MAELAGATRIISIATTSTGTYTQINGVDESTYRQLCDLLEISEYGDTYKKRIAGLKDTALALSGNYDDSDTSGQLVIIPGDTVYLRVLPDGLTGKQVEMLTENFEHGGASAGKQTFTASLLGNAAPTDVT